MDQLARVRKELAEVLRANRRRRSDGGAEAGFDAAAVTYDADYDHAASAAAAPAPGAGEDRDPLAGLLEMREHDVPYLVRACIDLGLRAGMWYTLTPDPEGGVALSDRATLPKAAPTVLAFNIECTKAPLKFPDADSIACCGFIEGV